MESEGLTAGLARFVAASPHAAYPPEALHAAKRAFIDTLGVMLAGRGEEAVRRLDRCLPDPNRSSPKILLSAAAFGIALVGTVMVAVSVRAISAPPAASQPSRH